jgi:hypothetical protein
MNLPQISRGKTQDLLPMFEEPDEDVDDDGNPLTVAAAQRIHHKDGTKKMYFPKQTYSSPKDSLNQLNSKKA